MFVSSSRRKNTLVLSNRLRNAYAGTFSVRLENINVRWALFARKHFCNRFFLVTCLIHVWLWSGLHRRVRLVVAKKTYIRVFNRMRNAHSGTFFCVFLEKLKMCLGPFLLATSDLSYARNSFVRLAVGGGRVAKSLLPMLHGGRILLHGLSFLTYLRSPLKNRVI